MQVQSTHADFILTLDRQQVPTKVEFFEVDGIEKMRYVPNLEAKRCPHHGGLLAVNREGVLYCADTKARTCDYAEMGVVLEAQ